MQSPFRYQPSSWIRGHPAKIKLPTYLNSRSYAWHEVERFLLVSKLYQHEGCFNAGSKAGVHLGDFYTSNSPVENCAEIASDRGFTEFSLEKGGHCRGGHDLQESYMNHGTSLACRNGVGARDALDIYSIKQRRKLVFCKSTLDHFSKQQKTFDKQQNARGGSGGGEWIGWLSIPIFGVI